MFRLSLRSLVAVLGFAVAGVSPAFAQTNAPSTNAPAAKAPEPVTGDIMSQAQEALAQLKKYQEQTSPDTVAESARAGLPDSAKAIAARLEADKRFAEANESLGGLQNARAAWEAVASSLEQTQEELSTRVRTQHALLATLNDMTATWKATLASANAAKSPPALAQTIEQVQGEIENTLHVVDNDLNDLYSLQKQVADQAGEVTNALDAIDKDMTTAQLQLFEQTHPQLWDAASFAPPGASAMGREKQTLREQMEGVRTYLGARGGAMLLQAFLFAILIATFFWIRNVTREHAKTEEGLRDAERIFDAPFATALLLALVASRWLYPPSEAPRLLWSIIGAIALAPTVIIVRRLISAELLPLLYATIATYFLDQVRYVATPAGVFARYALLVELIAVCIFILATLRSKQLCVTSADPTRMEKIVRAYLHTAFFIFLAAGFANVLGYVPLSFVIGNGMLESSYLAVVFYAAVRIVDALVLASLSLRPFSSFGVVRRHHDLVYAKTAKIIRWIATVAWVVAALQMFYLRDPLWQKLSAAMQEQIGWGSLQVQVGALVAFPVTIWAAFALSRLIRFAMEEDVYPNLDLPRGIPYAISTMIHYTILIIGFFIGLSALGINLSNYAVLAGAFGVGLGFGLQNIMNNFISGLILLFERPIKVGDTIQIDATTMGRVERIGIRASVVLLTNGSELIMPNGNLISNPVTNWTLSNCERLIEIPVSIAPRTDTRRVLDLLVDAARHNSAVLKNPGPGAIVVTVAAASTALKLRCWVDAEETDPLKVTTELTLAVQAVLEKENIALA